MKTTQRIYPASKGLPGGTMLFCMIAFARSTQAQQQILAPPPAYSVTPPAMQEYEASLPGVPQLESLASSLGTEPRWSQWGPVNVHPHLLYRFLYGDGIQSAPGQQHTSVINQFAPGVLFTLGSHWTLDYTPLFSYYSNRSFQDTVDESVVLTWGAAYQDWILGFSQAYAASSAPLVQTGTQTKTEIYTTAVNASYRFSSKISIDLGIGQNFAFAEQFTSTRAWSTMNWLNFEYGERWDVGMGAGYEYDDVNPGPNMMDEQYQGRLRWRATDKLSLALHAGLENQQYLTGGASSLITPIFGASIQYQPVKTTTISLTADRTVTPSLFQGQVTESTSVSIGVGQQLLKRLNLSAGATYGRSSYLASTNIPTAGTGRVDNYYSFNARLSTTFLKRGTAAVFYQYSDNPSTQPGFGFTSSQTGIELGYRF